MRNTGKQTFSAQNAPLQIHIIHVKISFRDNVQHQTPRISFFGRLWMIKVSNLFGDKDLKKHAGREPSPNSRQATDFFCFLPLSWWHFVAVSSWDLLRSFRNQLERAQEGSELSLFDGEIKRKVGKLTQNFFVSTSPSHCYFGHFSFSLAKRATLPTVRRRNLCVIDLTHNYLSDTFNRDRTHILRNGLYGHPISFHWNSITDIWAHWQSYIVHRFKCGKQQN